MSAVAAVVAAHRDRHRRHSTVARDVVVEDDPIRPALNRRGTFALLSWLTQCRCLGVFGMSVYTSEKDLKEVFGQYGPIESVQLVLDRPVSYCSRLL